MRSRKAVSKARARRAAAAQPGLFDRPKGKRGPGRPKSKDSGISHLARERLASRFPVHVTSHLAVAQLRDRRVYKVIEGAIAAGAGRSGFRLVQFTVQSNHLHLICEAKDRSALSRGLQGLYVRVARALNRHLSRRGQVFVERYHEHILRTPTEVRNALHYVLNNGRKHRRVASGVPWVDPRSSAHHAYGVTPQAWLPRARTWLLSVGWRRAGPLHAFLTPG